MQGLLSPPTKFVLSPTFFKDNRVRFLKLLKDKVKDYGKNSVILLKGVQEISIHDQDISQYPEQESNFFYLFGVIEEDCYATINIETEESAIYIKKHPDYMKYWRKLREPEYFVTTYHVEKSDYLDNLKENLLKVVPEKVYLYFGTNINSGLPSLHPTFDWLSEFNVEKEIIYPILNEARVIKSKEELELLRFISKLTSDAHIKNMQLVKPGMMEYELEAVHKFHHMERCGARFEAYNCICGSGPDTSILHYNLNEKKIQEGSMILNDSGGKYLGYISDITCSYPANGKFTIKQAEIYNAVLKAQTECYKAIKPGVFWQDIHFIAEKSILGSLLDLGILQNGTVEELWEKRVIYTFFPHGLGHFIGLVVHDVAGLANDEMHLIKQIPKHSLRVKRILREGMTLSNEPGIYFIDQLLESEYGTENAKYYNKEKIESYGKEVKGIRIEDNFIVTADGYEIINDVPRTISQIEACMSGKPWKNL